MKAILMMKTYIFKKDFITKINTAPIELWIKLMLDKDNPVDLLINNFKELTINDDRTLTEASITVMI